ncbi:MAG: hypothetical protein RLZZ337_1037 [Bacteroidota bacterium]|jgi:peptide/nickel transport system substrate-binding protein
MGLINRFFLVIHISFVLISCNSHSSKSEKSVFRYNSSTGITSLDPAFARTQENIRAVNQIFNGLVQLNDSLQVIPSIAKNWSISSDGKVYTFKLRNDVFFHNHKLFNGRKRQVSASDFVYSFNRIISPKTASDGAWIFNGLIDTTTPFEAPNDTILIIRLQKPFVPFLGMLSMAYCYVVPHEAVEQFGVDFGKNPIGTGPFMFGNWKDNIRLNLIQNPFYFESSTHRKIPQLEAISISFIASKQSELLEFIQGKLDVFTGLESSFKDEILTGEGSLKSKYNEKFELTNAPFLNTEYLAFNTEYNNELIQNKDFRKAMSLAINREAMIKYLRNNIGNAAQGGFIPLGLPGYTAFLDAEYNPQKARELLQNINFDLSRPIVLSTTKDYLDLCILVQKNLAEVGLTIKVDVIPSSLLKQQKSAGELSFFRSSWIADYPDAENYMACFYTKNKAPNGRNYTRFANDKFDRLYEAMIAESNVGTRAALFKQMEQILHNESPFILLFYDESIWLSAKYIDGFKVNALNHLDLRYVTK